MASFVDSVPTDFNWQQYVPPELVTDVNTGVDYYNKIATAVNGAKFQNGTLQLTDAQSDAALQTGLAAFSLAGPEGAILAGVTELILALGPKAGAGPGVCSSDPPPVPAGQAPTLSMLQSWSHFVSWESFNGVYGPDAAGSFEAFANPFLEFNWILQQNCFANLYQPAPALLGVLIAAWNAKHSATSTRSVCRSFQHISSFGANTDYDPIADAIYWSIVADPQYQGPAPNTWYGAADTYAGPDQATRCFTVNAGPVRIVPLTLHMTAAQWALANVKVPVAAAKTTATATVAKTAAAAGGTAVVAGILWGLATGKAWDWAFSAAWAEIKDMAAGEAREMREAHRPRRVGARRRR